MATLTRAHECVELLKLVAAHLDVVDVKDSKQQLRDCQ